MTSRRRRAARVCATAAFCTAMLLITVPATRAQSSNGDEKVLDRTVTISLIDAPLAEAFTALRRAHRIPLAWSGDVVPPAMRVTLELREVPLRNALAALLSGSGLDVVVTDGGTVVIVPDRTSRATAGLAPAPDAGASTTSLDVARAIAATGVRQLDRVVVIGSPVEASPEREQPTAVDVVNTDRIASLSQARATDVMRSAVPGVVFWDRGPIGPPAPIATVRGVASFTTRALKTYVDGIELASPELFTLVDGRAMSRIEMIRGPQGAALYGPDALNGVLQIETARGRLGRSDPTPRGSVSGGAYERSGLPEPELTQDYFGGLTGASDRASYDISAAFSRTGSSGNVPLANTWNARIGSRALAGPVIVDASARAARHEYALERPRLTGGSADPGTRIPQAIEERAIAVTAVHHATDWLRETIVVGYHWISGAREAFRSPILPPRLPLGATHETANRTAFRYSATADAAQWLTLSAGAEYSVRTAARSARRTPTVSDLARLYSDESRSTGAFAQARVRIGQRLIVSGGARGERLSSVGANLGTVWASTAGATWSHEFTHATMRVRAAWGNGIKPPEPGMERDATTNTLRQMANDDLAPERQRGIEGGVDLYLASGPFVRVTLYDQRATDLIQQVLLRNASDTVRRTYQYQNIGVIRNHGVEFETGARVGAFTASASAHVPRSEVVTLAPRYSGEFQPGDGLVEVPEAAGVASLRYDGARVHVEAGATWIGAWTGYDWIEIMRVELGQATERDAVRDYWMRYPSVVRPYIATSLGVTDRWRVFARVDNPANEGEFVRDNLSPKLGRVAIVGVGTR